MVSFDNDSTKEFINAHSALPQAAGPSQVSGALVSQIMEHYGVLVVHGVVSEDIRSCSQIIARNTPLDMKYELLLGITPQISCSTVGVGDSHINFFASSGLLLAQGTITQAAPCDSGSILEGNTRKIPESRIKEDVAQLTIDQSIQRSIAKRDDSIRYGKSYNELVVAQPIFGAIYYIVGEVTQEEVETLRGIAQKYQIPIIELDCSGKALTADAVLHAQELTIAQTPSLEGVDIAQTLAGIIPAFRLRSASLSCVYAVHQAQELFYCYIEQKNHEEKLSPLELKALEELKITYGEDNVSFHAVLEAPERRLILKLKSSNLITGERDEYPIRMIVNPISPDASCEQKQFTLVRLYVDSNATTGLDCRSLHPEVLPKDLYDWIQILEETGQEGLRHFRENIGSLGLKRSGARYKRESRIPGAMLHSIADLAATEGLEELAGNARQAALKLLSLQRYRHFMAKHSSVRGETILDPQHLIMNVPTT